MHENEVLVGPKQHLVFAQYGAPHSDRTRALTTDFLPRKSTAELVQVFLCHVVVFDHAPIRRYSKIKSSMRSCTQCDLYIQGTRWCTISSSFQELVELLNKNHLKNAVKDSEIKTDLFTQINAHSKNGEKRQSMLNGQLLQRPNGLQCYTFKRGSWAHIK